MIYFLKIVSIRKPLRKHFFNLENEKLKKKINKQNIEINCSLKIYDVIQKSSSIKKK